MSGEEGSRLSWQKGCLIALGVVSILGCCGFVLGSFACSAAYTRGQQELSAQVVTNLRRACEGHPQESAYLAELDYFEQSRAEIGVLSFSLVTNRYGDITADGTIEPNELDHMMALIADIHAHHGNVEFGDYPRGR